MKHVEDDYWNKLRGKSASCLSLLCKYMTTSDISCPTTRNLNMHSTFPTISINMDPWMSLCPYYIQPTKVNKWLYLKIYIKLFQRHNTIINEQSMDTNPSSISFTVSQYTTPACKWSTSISLLSAVSFQ